MSDRLPALKRDANRQRLIDAFDNRVTAPDRLWAAVYDFAKSKLFRLEHEFADMGSVDTVDDHAQEVAISVWKSLDQFRGDGATFYAWVHKIVFNQRQDFLRHLKEQQLGKRGLTIPVQSADAEADNPELYDSTERDFFITIPPSVQGIDLNICKLIMAGKNYAEVARMLSMSETAITQRVKRLKVRLASEAKTANAAMDTRRQEIVRREEQRRKGVHTIASK